MNKIAFILPVLSLLSGCLVPFDIPSKTQEAWRGRPISELQQKVGPGGSFGTDNNGERYYVRKQSGDFRIINPSGGLVNRSCEFRAYIDNQNRITHFKRINNGLNCTNYIYLLD